MPTKLYTIQDAIAGASLAGDHAHIQICVREHVQMHLEEPCGKAGLAWEIARAMDKSWYMGTGEEYDLPVTQDKLNNMAVDQYQAMLETWFTTTLVGDPNPIGTQINAYGDIRGDWGARLSRGEIIALQDLQRVLQVGIQRELPVDKAAMVETLHEWAGVTLPEWAAESMQKAW